MSNFPEFLARQQEHTIHHRAVAAESGVDAAAHARVATRLAVIIPPGTAIQIGETNPNGAIGSENADRWPDEDYTYGSATWEVQGELP